MDSKLNYDISGYFDIKDVENILVLMQDNGGSDIFISGGMPVMMSIHGRKEKVTNKKIGFSEAYSIITSIYGDNARSLLGAAKRIDTRFEFKKDFSEPGGTSSNLEKKKRFQFRLNAVSCNRGGQPSITMTFRAIPTNIPTVKDLNVEDEIVDICRNIDQGLIIVVGATGNGKSTLLAGILRDQLEDEDGHRNLVTIESPVEFVYDSIDSPNSIYTQLEVGKHVESFNDGVINSLRMAPTTILIGEARDYETIKSAVEASVTGHVVFSTVHANTAPEAVQRMVSTYPEELQNQGKYEILQALRMIVAQRLIKTVDGKRTAVREYLILNRKVKDELVKADNLTAALFKSLEKYGKPMMQDVEQRYKDGIISESEYNKQKLNYDTGE